MTGGVGVLRMRAIMKRLWMFAVGWIVLGAWAWAGEPTSALSFLVVKEDNGKPVRNAAVVLHPVNTHGKQGRGGFELKTDNDGKTHFDGVPYGKLRVQVLAPGFQTYGEDYEIDSEAKDIVVKLKRPQKQYSIYDDVPGEPKGEPKKDAPSEKPQ
jgi:Carboxypeptidase regulatory-like domain